MALRSVGSNPGNSRASGSDAEMLRTVSHWLTKSFMKRFDPAAVGAGCEEVPGAGGPAGGPAVVRSGAGEHVDAGQVPAVQAITAEASRASRCGRRQVRRRPGLGERDGDQPRAGLDGHAD